MPERVVERQRVEDQSKAPNAALLVAEVFVGYDGTLSIPTPD